MTIFRNRIKQASKEKSKVILANDYSNNTALKLETRTIKNIKTLHSYICGVKLNFHLLLPLGSQQITRINKTAHQHGLQTIADIKLNDIGNTNKIATKALWNLGFDAVIVNPIMGPQSLKNLVNAAHRIGKGVITLCYMSSPESKISYDMQVKIVNKKHHQVKQLYQLFLDWAILQKADGVIAGGTSPHVIKYCKRKVNGKLDIYSPGIGTQGGNVQDVISSGSNFLIIGRTILNAKDPIKVAKLLQLRSLRK